MKRCKVCGAQMQEGAQFCTKCGAKLPEEGGESAGARNQEGTGGHEAHRQEGTDYTGGQYQSGSQYQSGTQNGGARYQNGNYQHQQGQGANGQYYYGARQVDPYDHTSEFSKKDISENKVIAMLVYLLGAVGIIIALLGSSSSPYAAFHVRQTLKFLVIEILTGIVMVLLFWTLIVPIAGAIFLAVLFVVKIIMFFSICQGKAKEPVIVRNMGFLR